MNIGIIIFCTGKYRMFLDEYIKTCEEKFLPDMNKKYFIFTDNEVKFDNSLNFQWVPFKKVGWPMDTLIRYEIINKYRDIFNDMDYLLATNANVIFNETVMSDEVLPTERDGWMATVSHPNWFDRDNPKEFPYERNPFSAAYVAPEDSKTYCQACFVLGRKREFFQLSEFVEELSKFDLKNKCIPIYWDESYINKYWILNPPKILSPAYSNPDPRVYNINAPKKIILLEKGLYGGHNFLRS